MKVSTRFNAILFGALLALSSAVGAQQAGKPVLLVASPGMEGPYRQTTLVAVPVDGRYFGFILNRATDLKLSALFPEHAPSAKVVDPVYFGGPQMSDALFAVVPGNPGANALQLFGGLFVTNRAEAINRIIEQTPNEARYFAGFVGWAPGELEAEIASGHWYVAEPEAALVFRSDTAGMWQELVKRLGNGHAPARRGQIQTRFDVRAAGWL